jgi:hypothetical protein
LPDAEALARRTEFILRFPHLVSWAKLCPRTIQSGATSRAGTTGKGNLYLKGVLGEAAAAAAAKTDTFLGERYRRIVKRCGKLKALVAVARSILIIIWHLLADPTARYHDLGASYYASRIDKGKKARNHIRRAQRRSRGGGHSVRTWTPGWSRTARSSTPCARFWSGPPGTATPPAAWKSPSPRSPNPDRPSTPRTAGG